MKIKKGYILKEVAGENVLMFLTPELRNKIITLNESGVFLFKLISECESKENLISAMLSEYDIDEETATRDIDEFIEKLRNIGALED